MKLGKIIGNLGLLGFWNNLNLKNKIAVFVVMASVGQLAAVGIYSYIASQRAIDTLARHQAHDRAEALQDDLRVHFRESTLALRAIASSPAWLKSLTEPALAGEW